MKRERDTSASRQPAKTSHRRVAQGSIASKHIEAFRMGRHNPPRHVMPWARQEERLLLILDWLGRTCTVACCGTDITAVLVMLSIASLTLSITASGAPPCSIATVGFSSKFGVLGKKLVASEVG